MCVHLSLIHIYHLEKRFGHIKTVSDEYSLLVRAATSEADEAGQVETINKENFIQVFSEIFRRYKDEGFERVNPSIVKAAIQSAYPDFDEKQIGFRRFSDVIKRREKEGAGVNKRDVARYLNQQKKEAEEPINNAFAAALSGLKLDK